VAGSGRLASGEIDVARAVGAHEIFVLAQKLLQYGLVDESAVLDVAEKNFAVFGGQRIGQAGRDGDGGDAG